MTQAFEEEVKTPENNIYLADNPVALHGDLDAPSETVIYNGTFLGFQAFCASDTGFTTD